MIAELHLPWLEIAVAAPFVGAIYVSQLKDAMLARKWSLVATGIALACTIGAWEDFGWLHATQADDRWDVLHFVLGRSLLVMDQLSAPLLPLAALLYFLTTLTTLRTKIRRFSFGWMLLSESMLLATLGSEEPWVIIGLLAAQTVPPYWELRARGKSTRIYLLYMGLFVGLMTLGWSIVSSSDGTEAPSMLAVIPLLLAVLIRSGIAPVHTWLTDLFENATFGTALLFVTPIPGAYVAARLLLPIAPDWVMHSIGLLSLITAVYAAGMSLVQRDARRFFCYLFLSHSALVLVGLEMVTPIGVTGALCVWLSVGLALGGFGLTLRALEARRGRLSLVGFQGLYDHTPALAVAFLLTGLASVGFPGTLGFIGTEMLIDGAVETYSPYIGVALVIAAALNGIAILQIFFRLFTGTRHASTVSLQLVARERFAVLTLASLIIIGGLIPQFGVLSRHHAAETLLEQRAARLYPVAFKADVKPPVLVD